MDKNYIVKKSNYFIMNSSYDLSLEEQKIILTLASMVQPEDEEFKTYKFRIADFMKLLGIDTKTKYTEIPKITKELMKKVFEIEEENKIIQLAWLSSVVYEKGTGYVELEFSPRLKPYMLKLNAMFTQYKLANILNMKSKYSPRIYEILKCNEFKKQGFIEIEIDELKKILKAEDIYPRYNDFKRYVIIRTQKELKKLSDICFEFEEIKTGRKVTSIKFYIYSNKKNNLTKTSDEMAITVDEVMPGQMDFELLERINQARKTIKESITDDDIKCLLEVANSDIEKIKKAYEVANTYSKPIDNIVSFLIMAIKNNWSVDKKKNNNKHNFKQRDDWDFEELERLEREKLEKELNL